MDSFATKTSGMPSQIHFPEGQKFECRDCPARCCTAPWRAPITLVEKNRFEAEPWIQERLKEYGAVFGEMGDGKYTLPFKVKNRRLECLFLDGDGLCSQHRRQGFDFLSSTCKTFPFEFVTTEEGEVYAALSQYCPSIRDNYGLPVADQVDRFLANAEGKPTPLPLRMTLTGTGILPQKQYLRLMNAWGKLFLSDEPLGDIFLRLYALTENYADSFKDEEALPQDRAEALLAESLSFARSKKVESGKGSSLGRLLISMWLLPLTHPVCLLLKAGSSVKQWHGMVRNLLRLLRQRGDMEMLYLEKSFRLEEVDRIPSPLEQPEVESYLKQFYLQVLDRKHLFLAERDLMEVVLELGMSLGLILRFTRYRAASEGRRQSNLLDVREGVSVAEFLLLYHTNRNRKHPALRLLMQITAGNALSFQGIIGAEIPVSASGRS